MKISIIEILLILAPFLSYSQKQGNIWYFGNGDGLDFNNVTPASISGGQTGTNVTSGDVQEGTACISDSAGHLLFYTDGMYIWNRNHDPMPNGTGLMGGTSSTQSSIIVPLPGSNSIYYVFTADDFSGYDHFPEIQNGYRYSVIDMCLNDSLGGVIDGQKNILLVDSSTEKIAACADENGSGYWIMGHKMFSDEFHAWHLTSDGISETVISHIGTVHGFYDNALDWSPGAQGQMQFNSQGTKLAVAISNIEPGILEIFDFNNATGTVSNTCQILIDNDTLFGKRIYGIEFSPDGTKLYAAVSGSIIPKRLYQFDLISGNGNCNAVISSRQTLFQSNTTTILRGMQLAPNGKIYTVCDSYYNLGCINFPNLSGLAADFNPFSITLPQFNSYTLPSFIAGYKYHNQLPCTDYVPEEIIIPNVFTPNVDNINDTFIIKNLPANSTVQIYNRWGALVSEWANPNGSWDGHTKGGSQVSAGVYYYIVTLPDGERKKGFIQLIR